MHIDSISLQLKDQKDNGRQSAAANIKYWNRMYIIALL